MLKIANINIPSNLILAPMSGITDLAYRTMARSFGCEFAFLEMLNARAMSHKNRKVKELLASNDFDKPLGAQLLGSEIDYLIKAARVLEKMDVSVIDFNAACPVRKVVKRGEGAALLKQPKKLFGILKALVDNLNTPISLKMRSGWDKHSINAVEVARLAQKAGVCALFIHGRDREQGYHGAVSYTAIKEVKKSVDIPVIASGDILSPQLAKKMFEQTNCDGLLVARGSIGRPWIFKEIRHFREQGILPESIGTDEIKKVIFKHVGLAKKTYGEKIALVKMRRVLPFYIKNVPGARKVRAGLNEITSEKALRKLLEFL